jgi:hypothetical protein
MASTLGDGPADVGRGLVPLRSSVDTGTPRVARVYNCLLGDDRDSFASEREVARRVLAVEPRVRHMAIANRQFLGRAVRYAVGRAGIRQILDIGSGYPTQRNVHEVAQEISADVRTIYVDNDPVVAAHGRAILSAAGQAEPRTWFIESDLRRPGEILWASAVQFDFSRPVAVLLVAILHFVPAEEGPHEIVADLVGALAPGSLLVVSHVVDTEATRRGVLLYKDASAPLVPRSVGQIDRFFDGLGLVAPGLVPLPLWRPDEDTWYRDEAGSMPVVCAVGRKP